MDITDPDTMMIVAAIVVVVLIAAAAWVAYQKKESHRLEDRFGPEYGRTVDELGSRSKAEAELKTRQKRVEQLNIVALSPQDASRFSQSWKSLQTRFVDDPRAVVVEAEDLVRELMQKRGYPMGDFERRAADISVDHPRVVDHYRAAQAIAARGRRGNVETEELRKAVVHYRALFSELLEVREDPQAQQRNAMEARA
jgi:hypothetical protein